MNKIVILFIVGTGVMLAFFAISKLSKKQKLDSIENKTVGQGQHGSARWATDAEIKKKYKRVPFTPELWRKGQTLPSNDCQGIIVGCDLSGKNVTALERKRTSIYITPKISVTNATDRTEHAYPFNSGSVRSPRPLQVVG